MHGEGLQGKLRVVAVVGEEGPVGGGSAVLTGGLPCCED